MHQVINNIWHIQVPWEKYAQNTYYDCYGKWLKIYYFWIVSPWEWRKSPPPPPQKITISIEWGGGGEVQVGVNPPKC